MKILAHDKTAHNLHNSHGPKNEADPDTVNSLFISFQRIKWTHLWEGTHAQKGDQAENCNKIRLKTRITVKNALLINVSPGSSSIFCTGRFHISITHKRTWFSFRSFCRSLCTKSSSRTIRFQLFLSRIKYLGAISPVLFWRTAPTSWFASSRFRRLVAKSRPWLFLIVLKFKISLSLLIS